MIEILNGLHETVAFSSCKGIRLYHNAEIEDYPLHWHTALEIIMPLKNTYTINLNQETITCHEGDIFIIPPGELHELVSPEGGQRLIMQIDISLFYNLNKMDYLLHLMTPYKWIQAQDDPALSQSLKTYLLDIEEEYFMFPPFAESAIYSLLVQFFVSIGRSHLSQNNQLVAASSSKQYDYIQKFMNICQYINEHCTEDLTVEVLAQQAGFSKFHFSRLFKQFTNMSCYDYLIHQRITYAERLLLVPNLSITEVAMQSGFNSLSTFNRIFKSIKQCTPTEYKKLGYNPH